MLEAILAYNLICSNAWNLDDQVKKINMSVIDYIEKGWQPYGSPTSDRHKICQSVVKYK